MTIFHPAMSRPPDLSRRRVAVSTRSAAAWLFGLAVASVGIPQALGAAPVEVENLRVGFGPSNSFKVGAWTPVWVQLRGGTERFTGFMDVIVPDDDGTATGFRQTIELGPKESQRYTAYARPGGRDTEFTLRLLDAQGRRLAEFPQERSMPNPPVSVMPEETWILTMGQPQGVEQVPELPGFASSSPARRGRSNSEVIVTRIDLNSGLMPGRWYGLDGAQAIVVDTNDRATLQSLDALRGKALVDWVQRGGHLVVSVGANWQAVRDSVLGPILPAVPAGQERVPSLVAIETFSSSTKPITPPGTPPQMVTRLEEFGARGGKVLSIMADLPLVVRGAYGFGRVTLIGVDVDQKLFSDWSDRGLFWAKALDLRRDRSEESGNGPLSGGTRFYQTGVSDLSSQLRIALEQFPGINLIPFGWVAFFIFLYILLIGPGDYFFLKKVLKRMELTWITFPTIVISVSLLSYLAAYRLKGNDLLINKVDVIDVDQPGGVVRGRTWVSLFSPQNRDYNLGLVPLAPNLEQDATPISAPGPSGEMPRPPAGTEVVTSWFSVPEEQFGAMGGSNRRFSFGGGGYSYQPVGGVERLENLRIPIWSTKSIMGQWFGPAQPLLDSDLRPVGTDRLSGTVTNRQSYPLEDAVLAFGKQVYLLGTMAPGATVRVELSSDRNLAGHLRSQQPNYVSNQQWNRNFKINRADLMLAVMFHDSASNRISEQSLGNATLHNLDLTGQLALERPMLVARIKRPGAQLAIDNTPGSPKIDQTTVLRVILTLKRSAG